jgi:small-conductance mechanosensitive channel
VARSALKSRRGRRHGVGRRGHWPCHARGAREFRAGLVIIFTKPFRVGEYIELVGESGVVNMIDLLSTRLSHFDKSMVVIPNRKIVGEIFHNYASSRSSTWLSLNYDSTCEP